MQKFCDRRPSNCTRIPVLPWYDTVLVRCPCALSAPPTSVRSVTRSPAFSCADPCTADDCPVGSVCCCSAVITCSEVVPVVSTWVIVPYTEHVLPMIPAGKSVKEMILK